MAAGYAVKIAGRLMNKCFIALFSIVLVGCFSRGAYLTQEKFNQIQVGDSITKVLDESGKPYSVDTKPSGEKVYKYVETFSTGTRLIYENHYTFVVKDGRIVEKKQWQEQDPPYDLIYQDDPNHHYYP